MSFLLSSVICSILLVPKHGFLSQNGILFLFILGRCNMCKSCSRVCASTIFHVSRMSPLVFLVHNLRRHIDSFFGYRIRIVSDILSVPWCTLRAAVAP